MGFLDTRIDKQEIDVIFYEFYEFFLVVIRCRQINVL